MIMKASHGLECEDVRFHVSLISWMFDNFKLILYALSYLKNLFEVTDQTLYRLLNSRLLRSSNFSSSTSTFLRFGQSSSMSEKVSDRRRLAHS